MATLALPVRPRPLSSRVVLGHDAVADRTVESSAGTLDDRLTGAWSGLLASTAVPCPVCAADMKPRWSAGSGVVGGRCGGCGCTLE